ncbi:adenylate/guanylate cyclase domain-containing protein [Burkholderia multivorans]|uniref:Adenylate/guanylate cyclase domain-containing protein n=1 Tax=Burkholderia multivorans TaxID=87883 RepID=A0A8E2UW33_9BURK|nr:adenylate/guanylate cyclase domain-containing protein [Burkholderia multivorans]MBU9605227.1 adenylate/guanylate cyclase domain-containing protein [Burkholderia multivorans]PRF23216.1 adenylate/guanylate cyclase domain-containing protein [Burkholderia multivorans]
METNQRDYFSDDGDSRLLEILNAPAGAFEELNNIPDRSRLTYTNGFYVYCTAVFIDIRDSSKLTTSHTTPVLGKIYRAYISECIAALNAFDECKEIFISGDCVSGIFNTPYKSDINRALLAAATLQSVIEHLNWRLEQKGYTPIRCGIGISYGRALMIKSGFKGSGINDVVWMGDVVNEASNLCHQGNKNGRLPTQIANVVYENLTPYHKSIVTPVYQGFPRGLGTPSPSQYEGDLYNPSLRAWLNVKKPTDPVSIFTALASGRGMLQPSIFQLTPPPPKL